jgi:hypothetical protein
MEQTIKPALSKFILVAMADCINSEAGETVCWPSYAFLARRTGMNCKTVEASIHQLKTERFIVDTGRRAGDTRKVVVYRLNDPISGAIAPGLQRSSAPGTRPDNDTENGAITGAGNPPKSDANPPNNGDQSPQIVGLIPPTTGVRTRKRTRKEPGTEPGRAVTSVDGVPAELMVDFLSARKGHTLTPTALEGIEREAKKAGITVAEAIRFCCENDWRGFNAGWYFDRVNGKKSMNGAHPAAKHAGFATKDYREGVTSDGSLV